MEVVLLLVGLEFPALMALLDCSNRSPDHFPGGEDDRRSWRRWLVVGAATAWILVGNGIVLAYYHSIVRRNDPAGPG